jgi:hypothetical protein
MRTTVDLPDSLLRAPAGNFRLVTFDTGFQRFSGIEWLLLKPFASRRHSSVICRSVTPASARILDDVPCSG